MEDLREMQVKEAIERMKMLHIMDRPIKEFEKGGCYEKDNQWEKV